MPARPVVAVLLLCAIVPAVASGQTGDRTAPRVAERAASSSRASTSPESSLPENLIVSGVLREVVTSMWQRSPTFRRQCARIAVHSELVVRVSLTHVTSDTAAAWSYVERDAGALSATVQVESRTPRRYVEYIAHEIEHVLEHVDGADLPRLARRGLAGVLDMGGRYETARARAIGQAVDREVRRPRP